MLLRISTVIFRTNSVLALGLTLLVSHELKRTEHVEAQIHFVSCTFRNSLKLMESYILL